MTKPVNIAVFASGGGTNLQALLDACADGRLDARVCVVVSNNSGAFALERARRAGVPTAHVSMTTHGEDVAAEMLRVLKQHETDVVVLAGYMKLLPREVVRAYSGRVMNIHPALLPKFGGEGMYGLRVHEAVIASRDKESGATVHLVDEEYDHGATIVQKKVPVHDGDTPESLAARVLEVEHEVIVEAARVLIKRIRSED